MTEKIQFLKNTLITILVSLGLWEMGVTALDPAWWFFIIALQMLLYDIDVEDDDE